MPVESDGEEVSTAFVLDLHISCFAEIMDAFQSRDETLHVLRIVQGTRYQRIATYGSHVALGEHLWCRLRGERAVCQIGMVTSL